tara:strand:+ start:2579 stop:4363 length:1785 start_codon:yes stop_codon:yes gene_type:complete
MMSNCTSSLRILATTDLHMNITGFNYATNTPGPLSTTPSLAGLAPQIAKARAEAEADDRLCLLVDNGDFLQGTPLADWLSMTNHQHAHPMALIFNTLRYDAIGLGNHDLDYRMDYLNNFAAQITAPLICSNLRGTGMTNLLSAHTMTRRINSSDGMQDIKIGVLSVLPPETVIWNIEELPEGAQIDDPVTCITQKAKDLRAQGADLVIVLAHMGLGEQDGKTGIGDWGATALARLPCIDVIVAGHTHYRHPSDWPAARSLDPSVPVIMPGSSASHLGVLDLELKQQRNGQWRVEDHVARLRLQTNHSEPKIHSLAAPAHQLACTYLEESIGHTAERLHSYFALLRPSKIMALTARAKTIAVHQAIQGSDLEHLPILATATARSLRGAEGPSNFIDIPAGPVLRRHLAGMVPFTNKVCALILTSDKLAEWLEQSASAYGLQSPRAHRQPLLNPDVPMFVFDAIFGLSYVFDLSKPVGTRVSDLRHNGLPLADTQRFILATNHFRAAGGGGYDKITLPAPFVKCTTTITDALETALHSDTCLEWMGHSPWQLKRIGTTATFDTSAAAHSCFDEIATFAPKIREKTDVGLDRIEIEL